MKNKILSIFLISILLFVFAACTTEPDDNPDPDPDPVETFTEVIRDNKFAAGFGVRGQWPHVTGTQVFKILDYMGTASGERVWDMARWTCKEGFDSETSTEELIGGNYVYTDSSKVVKVNPETGFLYLELNTENEYEHPRQTGEGWPHLLIEQNFQSIDITQAEKIMAEITFTINKAENKMGSSYNSDMHTGHFLWYFTLRNVVSEGATYEEAGQNGDYLWYGVPLYDYRKPNGMPESAVVDGGAAGTTGKLIYSMPTNLYLPPVEIGQSYAVSVDILPYMHNAYNEAQSRGLLQNVKFENLRFAYMNLGWEVPGTFNVAATVEKLSTKVYSQLT